MSRPWKPDGESDRRLWVDAYAPSPRKAWPDGATAGLVLVAVACLAVGALLYQIAGPREPVEEGVARR